MTVYLLNLVISLLLCFFSTQHDSLEESEAALSRQLATDPLCINTYKATKGVMEGNLSFDDRAYVRFRAG